MNNKILGLTTMAASSGWLLALLITGSGGLWAVIVGLLVLLAGSLQLTEDWIPEQMRRRRSERDLDSRMEELSRSRMLRHSNEYRTQVVDRSLGERWLGK